MNKNVKSKNEIKKCQKCLKERHLANECKNKILYKYRPSKSELLKNGIIPYEELNEEVQFVENNEEKDKISEKGCTSEISVESSSLSSEHKEIRKKLLEKIKFLKEYKEKNKGFDIKKENDNVKEYKTKCDNNSNNSNSFVSEESDISIDSRTSSFSDNEYENKYNNKIERNNNRSNKRYDSD